MFLIALIGRIEHIALRDSLKQFRSEMLLQSDMTLEAENMKRFDSNLSKPWSRRHFHRLGARVVLPKVLDDYTRENLLVETYEDGMLLGHWMRETQKLDELQQLTGGKEEKQSADHFTSRAFFLRHVEDSSIKEDSELYQHLKPNPFAPRVGPWRSVWYRLPHFWETGKNMLHDRVNDLKQSFYTGLVRVSSKLGIPYNNELPDPTKSPGYGMKEYWPQAANAGIALFMQMLFVDNFIHADLHPGNMIIRFRGAGLATAQRRQNKRPWRSWIETLWSRNANQSDSETDSTLLTFEQLDERLKARYSGKFKSNKEQDETEASVSALRNSAFIGDFDDANFELVLLDCGLTTSLSVREYRNFVDLLRCIFVCDGYTAGG